MKKSIQKLVAIALILIYSFSAQSQSEITANELAAHVKFLASDSLKGRKAGTLESIIAAQYIADEFKHYGLKLLGENGFQYFDIQGDVKAGVNTLKVGKTDYQFGRDFTVLSYSENAQLKSNVVFVGYGFDIKKDSLKWNDYENINVKGKWVLVFCDQPKLVNNSNKYSDYSGMRSKVLTARDKGAIGVIFVSPFEFDKYDKLILLKSFAGDAKCGLPVIQIKRPVANQILTKSGKKIESLEAILNKQLKPQSFECKAIVDIKTEVNNIPMKTQNVIAYLEGSDPLLKSEYIVLGAHYDHLGFGGQGSGSRKPDTVAIHNGADDNASGVATLLEIAQYLASKKDSVKRSVLFIAFGAEESGLIGSQYYVNHPLFDLKQNKAMLNFDMVGRLNKEKKTLTLIGVGTAKEWEGILNGYQKNTSLKFEYSKEGFGSSDHASFTAHKIPVIHFFTGTHAQYHTPEDDAELLNYSGQEEVSRLASRIAMQLLTQSNDLSFQESGSKTRTSSMGELKVKLGIMPGFASSENNGLKVEGVSKDGPAYKAGLQVGDIITAINGEKISNIYDYMDRLKKYKPGDKITIDVKRGEENRVFNVDL